MEQIPTYEWNGLILEQIEYFPGCYHIPTISEPHVMTKPKFSIGDRVVETDLLTLREFPWLKNRVLTILGIISIFNCNSLWGYRTDKQEIGGYLQEQSLRPARKYKHLDGRFTY